MPYCPKCYDSTKVFDTREVPRTNTRRRLRRCKGCGYVFTTIETIEERPDKGMEREGKHGQA